MHRACPHPQTAASPIVTREHGLTTPAIQTSPEREAGSALHYPLQHYSSTRNRALDKSPGHPKGPEQPDHTPNFTKMTPLREATRRKPLKTESGTPLPTTCQKFRHPTTTDMRHSITGKILNKNRNRQLAEMRNPHT